MRRLALGAFVVLVAACTLGGGEQLPTLQAEAAGLEEVEGLRQVRESDQEQRRGLLGKQTRARVLRTYAVESDAPEEAARALVEQAVGQGWAMPSGPQEVVGGLAWQGTKPVGGEELTLTVSLLTDPDVVPDSLQPPVVQLDLLHPYRSS